MDSQLCNMPPVTQPSAAPSVSTVTRGTTQQTQPCTAGDQSIQLPKQLESVKTAQSFPLVRHRWNTNEEIASILIAFSKHCDWKHHEIKLRPLSGCMLLFNRNSVRYRRDGYCWKKRKDGRTIREDHMKLKVQGLECIYGSYVHSAILPTFHRRCYWLLQNPDIVLVHYLNVPYPNSTKLSIPVVSFAMEKKEWTKEELVDQLTPMFSSIDSERIPAIDDTILTLVQRLIENREKHQRETKQETADNNAKTCCHGNTACNEPQTSYKSSPDCCGGAGPSGSNSQTNFSNMVLNHAQDIQNRLDLAQGPLILNLGNLPNAGVMLVTGQSNNPQLSIISTSAGTDHRDQGEQIQQWGSSSAGQIPNVQSTMSPMNTFTQTVASQQHPIHKHYEQNTAQNDQNQSQTNCLNCNHVCQHSVNMNSVTSVNLNLQQQEGSHLPGFHNNQAASAQENIQNVACNIENIENTTNVPMQHIGVQNCGPGSSTQPIYHHSMTVTPGNGKGNQNIENVNLESFVEELNLELMATDKNTTTENEPKRNFEHLGDSFDSLHASLSSFQGSDLNLDQLDLIDLPEFEKICNDIANNGNIGLNSGHDLNTHTSQGGRNRQNSFNGEGNVKMGNINTNNISSLPSTQAGQNCGQQNFSNESKVGIGTTSGRECGNVKAECEMSSSCRGHDAVAPPGGISFSRGENLMHTTKSPSTIAMITDFSPDWAYTEGQTKVLVTGPWHSNMGTYSVLLDNKTVATTLVQPGVLRCFVPGHQAGLVSLQVCCDGTLISNTVVFQYKPSCVQETRHSHTDWFSVEECRLQQQLVDKLEYIESALSKVPDHTSIKQTLSVSSQQEMDVCLTRHLESLSARLWTSNDLSVENGTMGLSLLHLAAGLGYNSFIKILIKWRTENPSWLLEYDVDAHSTDLNSCTPLMWACAKGHVDAAISLYKWNNGPLHSFNREGNLPLIVARQHGHHTLADQLEQLESSGDLSHDLNSSQSIESISSSNIFSSQTKFDTIQQAPLQPKCSNINTVQSVRSTPEKSFYSSDYPAATSTPVTKDKPAVGEVFKSPKLRSKSSKALSALHIDIPPTNESNAQNRPPQKRDKLMRRQSDQALKVTSTSTSSLSTSPGVAMTTAERRQKLKKRLSVDILPYESSEPAHFSPTNAFQRPIREANSEPHLSANMELLTCQTNPMLSEGREMDSPELVMQIEGCDRLETDRQTNTNSCHQVTMDTDNGSEGSASSYIDVERVSSDDETFEELKRKMLSSGNESEKHQMVHLAKQIIAAMPERIKSSPGRTDEILPDDFERERSNSHSSLHSASPHASSSYGEALSSYGEDSGISTPMRDSLAFDEYRYPDVYSDLGTPASSLSPDSTCLHSPYSPYSFHLDSPPPTAAEFVEYFNAPATYMEKDFSQLTLSDMEQRKLYEAAKVIQSAYRQYRDKQCKQQNKEIEAAILIQSYYRRYKQYAYYKKMSQAAVLIQSQFRSYYAQKRFKKSRDAAMIIQNQYRSYKEHERLKKGGNKSVIQRFRSHYQRRPAGAGKGKGARVVQIVPDTGDGCPPEAANTAIDDCPQDTSTDTVTPGEEGGTKSRQTTPSDS